ncbi:MAG TPA: tail fiber domain-containing protein [Panacibacter sp.]|nr:tail fiber domain-containing protein [Panacibacter sp.]
MKTINTKALTAFTLLFICVANNAFAQNIFPATGRAGIYTTSPAVSLHVKGGARIGTTANYVNIDSATGNLSFNGTSTYKVADNKYAFQSAANPNIGLFFNAASVQYEFRNTSAAPVFYINANTGNGVFKGNLKIGAYTLPATDGTSGQLLKTDGAGNISWATVSGGGGANIALSNLAATAVNVSLLPGIDSARDIGSALRSWKDIYLKSGLYFNGVKMWQYKPGVNTIIGENAGSSGSGGFNTALGSNVLSVNTTGNANVAIGEYSLQYNTTGSNNTATGYAALISNNEGFNNVATGFEALYSNTTGHYNTGNGKNALYYNTTGSYNTAIGVSSLEKNNADENTAVGVYALEENTIGNQNTAVGAYSLTQNTEGIHNSAFGVNALSLNSTGSDNTANGYFALSSSIYSNNNTAMGSYALQYDTRGYNNTAMGSYALQHDTSGSKNSAFGVGALASHVLGSNNCAFGVSALESNTSGIGNTAVGFEALGLSNDDYSTAVGYQAGYGYNITKSNNTANTNGNLYNNVTESGNTAIGAFAGYSAANISNATAIGTGAIVDAPNKVRIGSTGVTSIGAQIGWTTFSDGRYKKNIKQDVQGLAFINSLQPITYTVDINGLNDYYDKGRKHDSSYEKMKATMKESTDKAAKIVYNGFIAQEVEKAAEKLNYNFSGVDKPQSKDGLYGLRYADFVVPLVKAVQELSKENEEQKKINADLQNQIDELKLLIQSGNQQSININQSSSSANLEQNIPNPFDQSTIINYTLPAKYSNAKIIVTDNSGKTIKQFILSTAGKGSVSIAAGALANGLYHYALYVDGKMIDSKKMEIIKQ